MAIPKGASLYAGFDFFQIAGIPIGPIVPDRWVELTDVGCRCGRFPVELGIDIDDSEARIASIVLFAAMR